MTFALEKPLTLPVNYQHLLQAFVYKILPQEDATYLHEKGFRYSQRMYKLFVFSSLQSPKVIYDKKTKKLSFYDKINLSISSIIPDLIENTANYLLLTENLKISGHTLKVDSLEFEKFQILDNEIEVIAVSPITVYSTFTRRNGSKITHYFKPDDKVFEHFLEENFIRKYEAFTKETIGEREQVLTFEPIKVNRSDKVVTNYKGTWITGWKGKYRLRAKPEYLTFLLNTGIGAKNSQGFGMILSANTNFPVSN